MSLTSEVDQAIKAAKWDEAQRHQAAALKAYTSGDPVPFKETVSHADDVTMFGGFGGWVKGWQEIEKRLGWSSSQYHGGTDVIEPLAQGRSGDLGYTVHLERISVRQGPSATQIEKTYRVTHMFRWEGDEWKLIHRHADTLIETRPPT
jgi:ketosteroid isomerase-like protein